jgi:hypothetical protein
MLTLAHIRLGLADLLDKRLSDLHKSRAGKYYHPMLEEQLTAVNALPPGLTGGLPLAAALDLLDATHDGHGGVLYFTTEVYIRMPDADPELVAAAHRIRAAFIPALAELGANYPTEADRAIERKPLLVSMKADLKRFPLAGGGTLLDTATAFLKAGEDIHLALSERADVPKGTRADAAALRSSTVGTLGRLRADVVREVKKDSKLPRDLEARLFGYLDTLEATRPAAKAAPTEPAASEAPAAPLPAPKP